jgi:hypothetical protein
MGTLDKKEPLSRSERTQCKLDRIILLLELILAAQGQYVPAPNAEEEPRPC